MVKEEKFRIRLLRKVRFKDMSCFDVPNDRWPLKTRPDPVLDQLAAVLKNNPGFCVEIQGHLDFREDTNVYSCPGSQYRANAVRHYLVRKGIAPGRLRAVGYGADRPLTRKRTKQAALINSRIEVIVVKRLPGPNQAVCWKP